MFSYSCPGLTLWTIFCITVIQCFTIVGELMLSLIMEEELKNLVFEAPVLFSW